MNNNGIWVYADQIEGRLCEVTLELLGKACELAEAAGGSPVSAVLMGDNVDCLPSLLFQHGAQCVYMANDSRLKYYQHTIYSSILAELIRKEKPDTVLFGATALSSDLAASVAVKIRTGLAAHCVDLRINEVGELVSVVPAFGGKVLGDILCPDSRPQMASVKPGIFQKGEPSPAKGNVVDIDLSPISDILLGVKPISVSREDIKGIPLEGAEVVLCGGWGIGSSENWKALEELAELLGGAVACTRPAVDEGWASSENIMVGTSGRSIRPKVYLGFGISGATHHICGMKDSEIIISINKDADAPIFEVSDYAVVGDLNKLLPGLVKRIKEIKGIGA